MKHIQTAILAARAAATRLENECPASQANTTEDAAHELIHALYDAANIAERAIGSDT